ncbi:MAG: hypothetical protein P1V81_01515 [Planctomycetota bacterium]|nr:hypothetical protein [Planctomycetota bacterium]
MQLSTLALACLALCPVASAGTWQVATTAGPGVDFTSIQAAIDAAADGDLIFIASGSYLEQLHVDGKGLTLQGAGNSAVFGLATFLTGEPTVHVENLAVGQEFHLRDLSVNRITGVWGEALRLEHNLGRVWIEQVFVDTYDGHALHVIDSADVVLSEVFLQCNSAFQDALGNNLPAHGLVVESGSSVHAFQVDSTGSHGPPLFTTLTSPVPGGDGVHVVDSHVRLIAPGIQGGGGGSIFQAGCSTGAVGGSAIKVLAKGGPAPSVELRGGTLQAGVTGMFTPGCAPDPGSSLAIEAPAGTFTQLAGKPRLLSMPSTPYPNGNFEFQVQGDDRDLFFLFASQATASPTPITAIDGDVFLGLGASFLVTSGQLNPFGWGGQTLGLVHLGPPLTFRTQALFVDLSGGLWLSGPGTIHFR